MKLTREYQTLHDLAVDLCRKYRALEWQIVEVLQKIEKSKLYLRFEMTSMFDYSVRCLGLSESAAYQFIAVARKSSVIPALQGALKNQRLTLSKAARLVSSITEENATELIDFAEANSIRSIDFEVARRNPKAVARESSRPVSQDHVELRFTVSTKTFEKLKRAQAVLAQKRGQHLNMAAALDAILDEYLRRQDPVEKAKRNLENPKPRKTNSPKPGRTPITAAEKHRVFARDGGRCTFRDVNGKRCENDRWLHLHHVLPVQSGGDNSPENLITLCSAHHDLVHQLALPLEGQVSWLKAPQIYYTRGLSR